MGILRYIRRLSAGFLPMGNLAVLSPEHQQLDGPTVGGTGGMERLSLRRGRIRRQSVGNLCNAIVLL